MTVLPIKASSIRSSGGDFHYALFPYQDVFECQFHLVRLYDPQLLLYRLVFDEPPLAVGEEVNGGSRHLLGRVGWDLGEADERAGDYRRSENLSSSSLSHLVCIMGLKRYLLIGIRFSANGELQN